MQKEFSFSLICIAYLASLFLLAILHIITGSGLIDDIPMEILEPIFTIIPQVIVMVVVPFFIIYLGSKKKDPGTTSLGVVRNFGLGKTSFKFILLAVFLGIALYILNIFIAGFFSNILHYFGYQSSSSGNTFQGISGLFITLILSAVLPGFCEEFLHRGALLNGFIKKLGVYKTIIVTSLLFGLMHMNIAQFFYATILGWFICVAVLASKSLWTGIIIHFMNNAMSVYMGYSTELNLPGIEILEFLIYNPVVCMLVIIILVISVGEILRYMSRTNFEKNKDAYVIRYMSIQSKFSIEEFENVKANVGRVIKSMPTWKAIFAYIETYDRPQKLNALEKALFTSMFVLGGVITVLSFWWGTL